MPKVVSKIPLKICKLKVGKTKGRSPGLVIMGDNSCLKGCGF